MESVGLEASDFSKPDIVVQLGLLPVRIDLLTSASGADFETCWTRRMKVTVGFVEAGFISHENLIANKRASGRPQDVVDVEILELSLPTDPA